MLGVVRLRQLLPVAVIFMSKLIVVADIECLGLVSASWRQYQIPQITPSLWSFCPCVMRIVINCRNCNKSWGMVTRVRV
jgi:hypothetical protein